MEYWRVLRGREFSRSTYGKLDNLTECVLQYSGILMFAVPFVGHKIWCRTSLNKPADLDIWTGKEEVDIYERENPPPVAKNT